MTERIDEVRLREETLAHLKDVMRDAVREGVRAWWVANNHAAPPWHQTRRDFATIKK